jgi:hypothetical protein
MKTVCRAEALSGVVSYFLLCNTTRFRQPSTPTVDRPVQDTSFSLYTARTNDHLLVGVLDQKRVQHRKANSRNHLLLSGQLEKNLN